LDRSTTLTVPRRAPIAALAQAEIPATAIAWRDVLGTAVLAVLSGHRRYAQISALRGETINASLLGMGVLAGNQTTSNHSAPVRCRAYAHGMTWARRPPARKHGIAKPHDPIF